MILSNATFGRQKLLHAFLLYVLSITCLLPAMSSSKCGAHAANDTLKFIAFGDWGGLPDFPYRTYIEEAVAMQMGKLATSLNIPYALILGDNFYFEGVTNVDDPRFKSTFEDVFTAPSLQRMKFFIAAGNHDWNGNVSAEIAYTQRSHRWYFPSLYYNNTFLIPNSMKKVSVVMIDTVSLCGNSKETSDGKKIPPSGPHDSKLAETQWEWIEQTLKGNADAEYIFVAGHFPVYSIAEHGPTQCLIDRLMPLLYRYHVSAYLCGHDHNIQHLEYTDKVYNWTVEYFLMGAANFIDGSTDHKDNVPPNSLKFHWANYLSAGGLAYMEITQQQMVFSFLESNGHVLYRKLVKPRF